MIVKAFRCIPLGVALCVIAACSKSGLERHEVHGAIERQGKPLARGTIEFAPVDPRGTSGGDNIVDGQYKIEGVKGLPSGEYIVRIYSAEAKTAVDPLRPVPLSKTAPSASVEMVSPKYNVNSTLRATVSPSGENVFNFKVD